MPMQAPMAAIPVQRRAWMQLGVAQRVAAVAAELPPASGKASLVNLWRMQQLAAENSRHPRRGLECLVKQQGTHIKLPGLPREVAMLLVQAVRR